MRKSIVTIASRESLFVADRLPAPSVRTPEVAAGEHGRRVLAAPMAPTTPRAPATVAVPDAYPLPARAVAALLA